MNDSQASCALDFACSCSELDVLTEIARRSGAYGSRLTGASSWCLLYLSLELHPNWFILLGAGWGGCTVSLVPEGNVKDFIQKMKESYLPFKELEGDALNEVIFATKPGMGACGKWPYDVLENLPMESTHLHLFIIVVKLEIWNLKL